MNPLFDKYPQLRALEDCPFFLSSMLMGAYSICWNDNLDIEVKTICENGETEKSPIQNASSHVVVAVRALVGISQKQLAALTGIDQSDISKIERGVANPPVATLNHIATALGGHLSITIDIPTSAR